MPEGYREWFQVWFQVGAWGVAIIGGLTTAGLAVAQMWRAR